jgi:hypothetical protein
MPHPGHRWTPPPFWRGAVVCVLGGGPSLPECWNKLKWEEGKAFLIGVNNALYHVPHIHLHLFNDACWWKGRNTDGEPHAHGVHRAAERGVITACCNDEMDSALYPCVRVTPRSYGLSMLRRYVGWYGNTGTSAVELAMKLGARKVVLVGFDLRMVDGQPNFFHNQITPADAERLHIFSNQMGSLVLGAQKLFPWCEVVNATPGSSFQIAPFIPPEDVLSYPLSQYQEWDKTWGEVFDQWVLKNS